jgi:hypothetical protein
MRRFLWRMWCLIIITARWVLLIRMILRDAACLCAPAIIHSFCSLSSADLNFRKIMSDYPMLFSPHRNPAISSIAPLARPPRARLRPERRLVFAKNESQMLVKINATGSYLTIYDFLKISLRSFRRAVKQASPATPWVAAPPGISPERGRQPDSVHRQQKPPDHPSDPPPVRHRTKKCKSNVSQNQRNQQLVHSLRLLKNLPPLLQNDPNSFGI